MTLLQPRKMKVNKKFQPIPMNDGDEFYQNGIFKFNITKFLTFIKANPQMFQPEEVPVKIIRKFIPSNLNESTIQVANIEEPIILAEIFLDRFNVIDGNHRLERAYRDGVSKILAYKVSSEKHVAFLTSKAMYVDYLKYWNSKIDEINEYND